MTKNFISVSGVTNREQLEQINRIYKEERFNFSLAIGYQTSGKSINQGTRNPRQPFFSDLGDLCKRTLDMGFIPAIHYYAKSNDWFAEDMEKIAGVVKPESALIQFNTLPLPLNILQGVKEKGFGIIFKVAVSNKQTAEGGYKVWKGEDVQDVNSGDVSALVNQVEERKDIVSYAMFDPSHGTNLELDLSEKSMAIKFGREIINRESLKSPGLVYAGGIGPGNVKNVTQVLNNFFPWRFSIDTESRVRNANNELDVKLVRDYLVNYASAFQQ